MLAEALSLAALLAACSPAPGPLGDGGVPGTECMSYQAGQPVTTGLYDLTNNGTAPVTITAVSLPGRRGMTMTRPWLVPLWRNPRNGNWLDVGVGGPYPPLSSPTWPQRRLAVGGLIRPHQRLTLVFGLTRMLGATGRSDGPAITYTASGGTWTVRERTSLIVAPDCAAVAS